MWILSTLLTIFIEWNLPESKTTKTLVKTPPIPKFNFHPVIPNLRVIVNFMLVRNEANRYLPQVLKHTLEYIDEAVILDDASEDNTLEVCRNILKSIPTP